MTNFSYTDSVPNANNDPSVDVPFLLTNTQSSSGIWDIDHIGFNANNGGTHLQNTFINFASPATPTSEGSVAYPAAGSADTTHAQYYFQNSTGTFLLNSIKAFGVFTISNVAPPLENSYNCSISGSGTSYSITLSNDIVIGNNIVVFIYIAGGNSSLFTYSFANPVLTIDVNVTLLSKKVNFVILQA